MLPTDGLFSPVAHAGAICPKCGAAIEGRGRLHVAGKLRRHLLSIHQGRIEPGAALALAFDLCECGAVATVKLSGSVNYICAGCQAKDEFRRTLELTDADYGRVTRDAALEDTDDGTPLPVHDWPASIRFPF
jgi:hypothetical protein